MMQQTICKSIYADMVVITYKYKYKLYLSRVSDYDNTNHTKRNKHT